MDSPTSETSTIRPEPEPELETKPEPELETKPDAELETKPDAEPEAKPESELVKEGSGKLIIFDLNGTLFDHEHSLRAALRAVHEEFPALHGFCLGYLALVYNEAQKEQWDLYLKGEIELDNTYYLRVQSFFEILDQPRLDPRNYFKFRSIWIPAYRSNRRASPGAIHTLTRLREEGYTLAVVTNGRTAEQLEKIEQIGIRPLLHHVFPFTSIKFLKPDNDRMFEYVLENTGFSPRDTCMVGDSLVLDIEKALNFNVNAIWYSPEAREKERPVLEQPVPVAQYLGQVPVLLTREIWKKSLMGTSWIY